MKKSAELLPLIIEASDKKGAIDVLRKVMSELYLTSEYVEIVALKDQLNVFKEQFREIVQDYKRLGSVKEYHRLHEIRVNLNFLYRDISDALVFDINRLKIYYEEYKTIQRAASIQSLKENEEFQSKIKATSASALRDIVGADEEYNEYVANVAIIYGLFRELTDVMNSIKQLSDSIASEERYIINIEQKDVK